MGSGLRAALKANAAAKSLIKPITFVKLAHEVHFVETAQSAQSDAAIGGSIIHVCLPALNFSWDF